MLNHYFFYKTGSCVFINRWDSWIISVSRKKLTLCFHHNDWFYFFTFWWVNVAFSSTDGATGSFVFMERKCCRKSEVLRWYNYLDHLHFVEKLTLCFHQQMAQWNHVLYFERLDVFMLCLGKLYELFSTKVSIAIFQQQHNSGKLYTVFSLKSGTDWNDS